MEHLISKPPSMFTCMMKINITFVVYMIRMQTRIVSISYIIQVDISETILILLYSTDGQIIPPPRRQHFWENIFRSSLAALN
jgi:hypothetical protein